jgi:hypothetical protein
LPPIWKSWVMAGLPSRTMPAFAVVPPMSNEMTSAAPTLLPTIPAAATPAAPPDSTVATGRRAAAEADITPPLDSMISTGQRIPISCSRDSSPAT